jgi:hypothetical protein
MIDAVGQADWALLKKSSSLYANVWQSSQIFSDFFSLRKALIASPPSRSGSTPPPTARLPPRRADDESATVPDDTTH